MRDTLPASLPLKTLETDFLSEAFSNSLPLPAEMEPEFEGALRHVLDNPGTLVRPKLVYQMAATYGMDPSRAKDLAIALEYFHTAFLLVNDLPCMDDALERRGEVCTHLAFGEESAILASLALINRAYRLAWHAVAQSPREVQDRALNYIESSLGVAGLLAGQSFDLHYSSLPHTLESTEMIARGETVSLIRLTLVLPALLGGATAREQQELGRISVCWGLGYQIVDDLKDVLQSATQNGKTGARVMRLNRPNIAEAIGIPASVRRLARLIDVGDRVLRGLLARRPELEFLEKLRCELQELAQVTRGAFELVTTDNA